MKSLRSVLVAVLCLIQLQVWSQNQDSIKIIELQKECGSLFYSEPLSAKAKAQEALSLSQKIQNHYLEALSFNYLGIVHDVTSNFDSAKFCYNSAIKICETNGFEVLKARAFNNLGLIYWNLGELDRAIEYYTNSLNIFEKNDEQKGRANALSNIGALYADKEEYIRSAPFHLQALSIRQGLNDDYGVSVSYANLGVVYMAIEKYDSAQMYIQKSIVLKDSVKDRYGMAINYNNLGSILKKIDKQDSAVWAMTAAKNIMTDLGQNYYRAAYCATLGGLYTEMGDYDQAYAMLDTAEQLALELDSKRELLNIYGRYSTLDTLVGNYKLAARHLAKRIHYQSEQYNVEKDKVIRETQAKYQSEKRDRELAENQVVLAQEQIKVRQRTAWAIALVAVLVLLIVIGFNIYRRQRLKQQKIMEESDLREKLSRAEIKASIEEERVRISRDLHDHIGAQLTIISSGIDQLAFNDEDAERKNALYEISDNSRETTIKLRETIWAMNQEVIDLDTLAAKTREFVSHLKIESCVFEVKLKANETFKLSPVLAIHLYRIIQEAVNNAVKYSRCKKLVVSFEKDNGSLSVEVIDDGRGFVLNDATEKGYGLVNMKERVKKFGGTLDLTTGPGKGTQVSVKVPLN